MWPLIPTMIVFVILMISGLFLSKLGLQPIRIKISDDRIRLEYLSFDLNRIKKTKEALFENITEFSDYSPNLGLKLTLYFKNQMTFELYKHERFQRKDDFEQLLTDFRTRSEQKTFDQTLDQKFPKYWDYYKSKDARFWFIVAIVSIPIFLIISIWTKDFIILIMLFFPLAYIFRYKLKNKK
jgi:hypothetical protein